MRTLPIWTVALTLVLAAPLAAAQNAGSSTPGNAAIDASANDSPPNPASDDEALFARAVTLLQDGQNRQAVVLLEQLRTRREIPAVLYNLMLGHRALAEYLEAREALQRYRALAEGHLDPARQNDVQNMMTEIEHGIAHVTVVLRGEGDVAIDGQPFPADRVGHDTELNPGVHIFRVTGRTIHPLEFRQDLRSGPNPEVLLGPEALDLRPTLRVSSVVSQAEIMVDQLVVGSGRYIGRVRAGQHTVTVRAAGYHPYSTTVSLAPNEMFAVQALLVRDIPITARWWFWTGVGVVTGAITAAALGAAYSGEEGQLGGTSGMSYGAIRVRSP